MSRVGSAPIQVPAAAEVKVAKGLLRVKGPKGELTAPLPEGVTCDLEDGTLTLKRDSDEQAAFHGMARALAQNAVTGVTKGFVKNLEIVGVGYRAAVQGRVVVFSLGYSHAIELLMPEGVDVKVDQNTKIEVSGADKQKVGQTAAMIRSLRPPDPYKQKGVRYVGEVLRKKEGKTGAAV